MPAHSATLSSDEADTFGVLVSSLATPDDQGTDAGEFALPVADLIDYFAVLHDPRDQRWVKHPAAAVLTLCAAAVVAGIRSFTAIAGWNRRTPLIAAVPSHTVAIHRVATSAELGDFQVRAAERAEIDHPTRAPQERVLVAGWHIADADHLTHGVDRGCVALPAAERAEIRQPVRCRNGRAGCRATGRSSTWPRHHCGSCAYCQFSANATAARVTTARDRTDRLATSAGVD